MELINGKALAKTIQSEIREEVDQLVAGGARAPHLAAILVGDDPASHVYVRNKMKACERTGFQSTLVRLEADITQEQLLAEVEKLNNNPEIDGFIVQSPLPKHLDEAAVTLAIRPDKDADGFHPMNWGRLAQNLECYVPATPLGIVTMLDRYDIPTEGKHCVVIGRSTIVGLPMNLLMSRKHKVGNATVTICHSRTKDLAYHTRQADILIVAIGRPNLVTADMVKEGVVVIDVGINRIDDASRKRGYRLVGDVDFDGVAPKASHITPVPGGVGPMTVTALLMNTLHAYKRHQEAAEV